jgi:hypothetical protein
MPRQLTKDEWAKLKAAFVYGHSLGSISEATGIPVGTLKAHASKNNWWHDRVAGTEILRKERNENEST